MQIVVGRGVGDDLIGARIILQRLEIAPHRAGRSIQAGPFDLVGIVRRAGRQQQIAHAPIVFLECPERMIEQALVAGLLKRPQDRFDVADFSPL